VLIDPALAGIRKRVAALIPQGSTVLDVGCGTGDQLLYLSDQIKAGLGVDLSANMIRTCKQKMEKLKVTNCEFKLAEASRLSEMENKCFDYAMSSLVIHEMPVEKRIPVLTEMKRLGRMVILVDWIHPQPSTWKNIGTHLIERMAGREHYSGFRSFMKAGGMPVLLDDVGLEIVETQITSKGTIHLWVCKPQTGKDKFELR